MSLKVLLVEDHKILRECISTVICKKFPNFKVIGETNNALSALELVEKFSPQIVIMDISLPGMNGIEATRKIISKHQNVKVIILSMHKEKEFILKALEAGASGYLLKTCDLSELTHAINSVMNNKRYLSPEISDEIIESITDKLPDTAGVFRCALTQKEKDIVVLYTEGRSTKEIALQLKISTKTVDTHRMHIMSKLNINTMAELTKYAIREGLTSL